MRTVRILALVASLLGLVLTACSGGGLASETIASRLTLGGPPECPDRPFCGKGLKDKYGLTFKAFTSLDAGGPATVGALTKGDIQVGLLFTSDPAIVVNRFVLLRDDKNLQRADNVVPVARAQVVDANPVLKDVLEGVMVQLDQDELIALNKATGVEGKTVEDVASAWLDGHGPSITGGSGTIRVGSANFSEQVLLGEVFAEALERAGFTVERMFQLGNREKVYPKLAAGDIDVLPEYAATLLEFVNKGAGEATTEAKSTVSKLNEHLSGTGLVALAPAAATDQNGFAVTRATADAYGLEKLSDLARAPGK
jgi:osmoprotectant transport system substrate-binding protein